MPESRKPTLRQLRLRLLRALWESIVDPAQHQLAALLAREILLRRQVEERALERHPMRKAG